MKISDFSNQIDYLMSKDDLKGVIDLLHKVLKKSPKLDEAILHSARYSDLTKQIRLGVIDFEQANISKNRIRLAVLELVRDIEDACNSDESILDEVSKIEQDNVLPRIGQWHTGTGDNVAGDKITYNSK